MKIRRVLPAWAISFVVHIALLVPLAFLTTNLPQELNPFAIETQMLDEDRAPEEFTQEMDKNNEVSENLNMSVAGGFVADSISGGSNSSPVKQTKIDEQNIVKDPDIHVNVGSISTEGLEIADDVGGPGDIKGEPTSIVEGYGAALDGMSKELIRMMRTQRVLVVWLFDESESMKDDQQEIKARFGRIYEELGIAQDQEITKGGRDQRDGDTLLTVIMSYGAEIHNHMVPKGRPTSDIPKILQAIDQIPNDKTGKEVTNRAIHDVVTEYRRIATQGKRKLVIIVVSDESGDDGEMVEEALQAAKSASAPIYVMGRESVFGYPFAHISWIHPQTGGHHYLQIRRGPETPYAEQLQIDGFHRRYDSHLSGFGPYEQTRLVRDTGGMFFVLPNEEQNVVDNDRRKYDALDMKEYIPDLSARIEYARERDGSKFRAAIWQAILMLNPYDPANKDAEVPTGWFTRDPKEYGPALIQWRDRIVRTLQVMAKAEEILESVRPLREKESSVRWRASYDLILGQMMAYRLRLFQYLIGLDQYARSVPTYKFKDPKSNRWSVGIGQKELLPTDAQQEKFLKVTLKDMQKFQADATKQLQSVIDAHPRTPWAKRAEWEISRGFGPVFQEHFHIPPPPPPPGSPPPSPPPNL